MKPINKPKGHNPIKASATKATIVKCPLCCNETFDSCRSLRRHLIEKLRGVNCPMCGKHYTEAHDLIDHLTDEGCVGGVRDALVHVKQEHDVVERLSEPDEQQTVSEVYDDAADDEQVHVVVKNEGSVDEEEEEDDDDEELYYCSSCNVSFPSIEQHINKFHKGQDVFFEQDDENKDESDTFLVVQSKSSDDANDQVDEDDDNATTKQQEKPAQEESDQTKLQTIKAEHCVDKTGCSYTRKVVQIDKFWLENSNNNPNNNKRKLEPQPPPLTLSYVLEDGKAKKVYNNKKVYTPAIAPALTPITTTDTLKIYQCVLCRMHFVQLEQFYKHSCTKSATKTIMPSTSIANTFTPITTASTTVAPPLSWITSYKCATCSSCFTSTKVLLAHMKTHNKGGGGAGGDATQNILMLAGTDNNVITMDSMTSGKNTSGSFVCKVCNTEFKSFKSLRLHYRMHEPIKNREIDPPVHYGINGIESDATVRTMFTCTICNKQYDIQYEAVHMGAHAETKKFDCDVCNRKFTSHASLDMHSRVHATSKKFTCSYCKKSFVSFESLDEHVKHQCQCRPYECQYCGRRFIRPHEKVKHERIHTGEKPHMCQICGKAFRVSYCLTLHMRTHSGTRPYQCQHCGKRFKAHSVYNHHLLTHSAERNYKCPYCPKAFKTGVQLAGHKNSHTKPFSCTECNRPFASLYAVRLHMDTHKRENNLKFKCDVCGASYARAFALRDHVREQHEHGDGNGDGDGAKNKKTHKLVKEKRPKESVEKTFAIDDETESQAASDSTLEAEEPEKEEEDEDMDAGVGALVAALKQEQPEEQEEVEEEGHANAVDDDGLLVDQTEIVEEDGDDGAIELEQMDDQSDLLEDVHATELMPDQPDLMQHETVLMQEDTEQLMDHETELMHDETAQQLLLATDDKGKENTDDARATTTITHGTAPSIDGEHDVGEAGEEDPMTVDARHGIIGQDELVEEVGAVVDGGDHVMIESAEMLITDDAHQVVVDGQLNQEIVEAEDGQEMVTILC